MTIFWHPIGPKLSYTLDEFVIEDLNPEMHLTWRIGRWQLFKIGLRCMFVAIVVPRLWGHEEGPHAT